MAELNGAPASPDQLETLALTNYGHFTTMLVRDGRVRGLSLHLDRLARDCRTVFDAALDTDLVRSYLRRAVPSTGSVVVRATVFDPALGLARMGEPAHPQVLVTTRPAAPHPGSPLRVRSVGFLRDTPEVKSTALFGALLRRREAVRAGYDDALFTDPATGTVLEGGTWNIAFIRDDSLTWPSGASLPGITAELLRQLHPSTTGPVPLAELADCQAAFATNAATGLRPIASVDGVHLTPAHPLIDELARAYEALPGEPV